MNISQSFLPKLNGENYEFWSVKMKNFFISQDLWEFVEDGYVENDADVKELWKKDAKALFFLGLALEDQFFPRIARAEKSKDAWTILKQEFHGNSTVTMVKLQTLRREFETLFMKGNESIQDFFV